MKKCLPVLLLLSAIITSCNKDSKADTCAVNYNIDSTVQRTLVDTVAGKRTWDFVGFMDTVTKKTDSPLCGNVESDITFTDSVIATHTAPYYSYKYLLSGTALINYFSGSYNNPDGVSIQFSATQNTSINGTSPVQDFEGRFHQVLGEVTKYRINHNELTLYPASGSTVMLFKADE